MGEFFIAPPEAGKGDENEGQEGGGNRGHFLILILIRAYCREHNLEKHVGIRVFLEFDLSV